MKELLKGKIATTVILVATFILAGVAVFTAIRLYQLRQVAVAPNVPESEPLAWDCSRYTFSLSPSGRVSITNDSSRNEPLQSANVYINNNLVATFNVPALMQGESAELGVITLPQSGTFQWIIKGTLDCQNSGSITVVSVSCNPLTFTISGTPSPTSTGSPKPSSSPTATPAPTVTGSPKPSSSPTATPVAQCNNNCTTNADCPADLMCSIQSGEQSGNCRRATCVDSTNCTCATSTPSPAPTSTSLASTSVPTATATPAALPQAGTSWATYFGIGIAVITIIASLMLAL